MFTEVNSHGTCFTFDAQLINVCLVSRKKGDAHG